MNIGALFGHMDLLPFVYGFMIFVNLFILAYKFKKRMILSFIIDIAVFWAIFNMHSGSMTGALAALIAATFSSMFLPLIFRRRA